MNTTSGHPLTGRCQCGKVSYEVSGPFVAQMVCHCSECQKLSATAFSITALVNAEDFRLVTGLGHLKTYARVADSGHTNNCYFCGGCGNRIYHQDPEKPQQLRLKPGTLDNTDVIHPTMHVWVKHKQSWVQIPDNVTQYETQPVL